nr:hypothetical protein [Streptomyces antibioticus]
MQGLGGVVVRPETREPPDVGELLTDTARNRVGEYRGEVAGKFCLRPVGGGTEWEVSPEYVRGATDEERLKARLAASNARSSGRP